MRDRQTKEAVYLALRCCTQPGDIVAVESPTYYGLLQILEALNLQALEIPTDPVSWQLRRSLKVASMIAISGRSVSNMLMLPNG